MSVRKLAIAAASALTIISSNAQAGPVVDKENGIISEGVVLQKSAFGREIGMTKALDCNSGILSVIVADRNVGGPAISSTDIGSSNATRQEAFRQQCKSAGITPGF